MHEDGRHAEAWAATVDPAAAAVLRRERWRCDRARRRVVSWARMERFIDPATEAAEIEDRAAIRADLVELVRALPDLVEALTGERSQRDRRLLRRARVWLEARGWAVTGGRRAATRPRRP